jgi:hypothetical protein
MGNSDTKEISLEFYNEFSTVDYIDHLKSFEQIYSESQKKNILPIRPEMKNYLKSIVKNISQNNELFFTEEVDPTFYIIDSKIPFHFSLPGRKFFLSRALLQKYIKNETLLYCVLAYELIRSEKNIYKKTIVIPTANFSTTRILSLLRLNIKDKVEIHKWAYYLLKRIGIETDTYLTWLQVKNRNSLDFVSQLGDVQSISVEESMFKAFLILNSKSGKRNYQYKGSSKKFYSFISNIKGHK